MKNFLIKYSGIIYHQGNAIGEGKGELEVAARNIYEAIKTAMKEASDIYGITDPKINSIEAINHD